MPSSSLYETDFYAWTQAQVSLLKAQQWEQLDPANLIEEIETLGRKERQELRNRLDRLLAHLLKRQFRSRSNSWSGMIREQRVQIRLLIQDSPSLKPYLEQGFADAYELGLSFAMALLHKGGVADGRDMVSFNYHTKTCHESSIPHPQLV